MNTVFTRHASVALISRYNQIGHVKYLRCWWLRCALCQAAVPDDCLPFSLSCGHSYHLLCNSFFLQIEENHWCVCTAVWAAFLFVDFWSSTQTEVWYFGRRSCLLWTLNHVPESNPQNSSLRSRRIFMVVSRIIPGKSMDAVPPLSCH